MISKLNWQKTIRQSVHKTIIKKQITLTSSTYKKKQWNRKSTKTRVLKSTMYTYLSNGYIATCVYVYRVASPTSGERTSTLTGPLWSAWAPPRTPAPPAGCPTPATAPATARDIASTTVSHLSVSVVTGTRATMSANPVVIPSPFSFHPGVLLNQFWTLRVYWCSFSLLLVSCHLSWLDLQRFCFWPGPTAFYSFWYHGC